MIDWNEIAKANFEGYSKSTGGLTWDKKPIPAWDELPEHVRTAWRAGAYETVAKILEIPSTSLYYTNESR